MYNDEGKDFTYNLDDISFDPSAVPNPSNSNTTHRYISNLSELAPGIVKLITENGYMVEGSVKSASDYSYSAPAYAGPGFRIAGDAGGKVFFARCYPTAVTRNISDIVCVSKRSFSFHRPVLFKWRSYRFHFSHVRRSQR
jgi:flavine halogenase